MGSDFFHGFKRQASLFLTETIRTARLALTDVTPAELMTEEATNGHAWPQDTRTMGVISRAAFEVDDYWRIMEILHKRLSQFDRENWRVSYNALVLLEHLLTHGPRRVAEEFLCDKQVIKEIGRFQYIDERGFNWGLSVTNSSERVLKLLESEPFLKEERARARKLTHGIEGYGSFGLRFSSTDAALKNSSFKTYGRCSSHYNESFSIKEGARREPENDSGSGQGIEDGYAEEDHPFCDNADQTIASLLSTTE
ncbi:hypothetical protein FH972_001476 [Carpinus fangiana]|uniref:ENTH domain-containing protein n=1 Tax=Carpinus fangiana TaxID=176857 RepID=A0A5N6QC75_9ROSI|nr:hypothetical protein FH972_001476 [Carpinus fangiana]